MEIENPQKQKLLIEYLISSTEAFSLCQPILNATYFDPSLVKTVVYILTYYNKYRAIPSVAQIAAESDVRLTTHQITADQLEFTVHETETFCKRSAIKQAILESVSLYEKDDYGKIETSIRDAITTSVHHRAGVGLMEDIDDILERLKLQPAYPTNWPEFDAVLGGGLRKREMLLLSANSGGGKSIVMANMGLNYLLQGLRVLYISFELPVEMIAKRYISMMTDVGQTELLSRGPEVSSMLTNMKHKLQGQFSDTQDLVIERLPSGSNTNDIRAFLREYELRRKHTPDVLILDYLDLMGPNEKVAADQVFAKDKATSEQVYQLLVDYNMIGITASQQNRCLTLDTEVITTNGPTSIGSVQVGDLLWDGVHFNAVTEVLPVTTQQVYEITTKSGKTIKCSGNHKWPTIDGLKTIHSGLTVGDKLFSLAHVNSQS